jgi:hypothetical protein
VIDHKIDRDQWLDNFWIATEAFHRAAHRRQINHQRHTGEILKNNPRNNEWDLFVGRLLCVPIRQRLDVLATDLFAIAISQDRFKNDANADGETRNFSDALLFQFWQRMEKTFAALSSIEFLEGVEFVIHFVSHNLRNGPKEMQSDFR